MEIPENLKQLYSHWRFHTEIPQSKSKARVNSEIENQIIQFASERMTIWEKKTLGHNSPFTRDNILKAYRFCNIYRELDKQTIEIHQLLKPLKKDLNLWLLNILFCRLVCKVETIKQVGLLSFDNGNNKKVFQRLKDLPRPKYGTAYIFPISVIMKSKYPTREEFFCFYLPKVVKKVADEIKKLKSESVVDALTKILPVFGFNLKFHWTEVLIDLAYQHPKYIDLFKEFPIGPGSIPTMKYLNSSVPPEEICLEILMRQPFTGFPYLTLNGTKVYLSAENIEGIGCEFRKYTNLRNGSGRRRIYKRD